MMSHILIWVNFQLISDAGFQGEITSVSTAAQQIEVFSRILKTSIGNILSSSEEDLEKNIKEFTVRSLITIISIIKWRLISFRL